MDNRRIRKNEALLFFGSWTSKIDNIVFDYANSISIVGIFADKPWVLAFYQSSETVIQIVFKDNVAALILFLFSTGFVLVLEPVIALGGNYLLCLVPFSLFGASLTAFNIQFMSYVQIAVDENYLGRVFSIIFTVAVLLMPAGSFVFSVLLNTESVNSYYTIGGGIMLLSLISMTIYSLAEKRGIIRKE